MEFYKHFPVLVIDPAINTDTGEGRAIELIIHDLKDRELSVIKAATMKDGLNLLRSYKQISCALIDWEVGKKAKDAREIVDAIRKMNDNMPIFLMTEQQKVSHIDIKILGKINGYIWKMEDTANFISGRVERETKEYLKNLVPPFFRALIAYSEHYKYAWHTPGHMGGDAFLKSPVGRVFFEFFGERIFRSDLSVSVPELGSLMEHSGVTGAAEREAAEIFGAEQTYFVTNGTSTANKIVMCGCVTPGDVVLVDRNCHKSLQYALTLTGAIPVYFMPTRNALGIIGGIHIDSFDKKAIKKAIAANPLIKNKNVKPKLAVVTNSTYDGLIYDVVAVKEKLSGTVDSIHFDEAWYAYAKFYDLYEDRYGMCETHLKHHPAIFATQSTHKLLAAFSQASMVHVKSGAHKVDPDRFNEAFMMHTSTSPQYTMVASLDVAAKMMMGSSGQVLIKDAVDEAIVIRKKVVQIKDEIMAEKLPKKEKWFFDIWQPTTTVGSNGKKVKFEKSSSSKLAKDSACWYLNRNDGWHGYKNLKDGYMMLDPIKVSIVTPGILANGEMAGWGIPAPLLASFLITQGIVDEKTGFYSFLLLFSIGVTKAKSGTLLATLFDFKKLYDENVLLEKMLPDLVAAYPERYKDVCIQDLAQEMHQYLKKNKITKITQEIFSILPEPVMTPAEAYYKLVEGKVKNVKLSQLKGKTAAVMLVPYPPGIPIVMPGEKFNKESEGIIDYLKVFEGYDNLFPGFETETHGLVIKEENGRKVYYVPCISEVS